MENGGATRARSLRPRLYAGGPLATRERKRAAARAGGSKIRDKMIWFHALHDLRRYTIPLLPEDLGIRPSDGRLTEL